VTIGSSFTSSSGSLVFKARDRFENLKTVAIKKIPLSTLAGASSDYRSHGTPSQSDVDYFVGSIIGHSSEDNNHNNYPNVCGANPEVGFTTLKGGNHTAIQPDTALFSLIGKQSGNRDRVMEYLGCHQTDSELWVSALFWFVGIAVNCMVTVKATVRWRYFVSPNGCNTLECVTNMRRGCET